MTNAIPVFGESVRNNSIAASNPPAEPPMPTIGQPWSEFFERAAFERAAFAILAGGVAFFAVDFAAIRVVHVPTRIPRLHVAILCRFAHLMFARAAIHLRGLHMAKTKRDIIVIGTSAGGVDALCELTKLLPRDLDASVFVVMHIGSTSTLPQILSRCGNLPAVAAKNNKRYETGCVYCAPPHCHLSIKDHKTVLTRGARENGHRPAADVLFRSAARTHREKVVGIVLSGGRDDGSAGLFAIKARGGVAIVQDPKEAMTKNMPQNALDMVDVDFCLPIRQIAKVIVQLVVGKAT